MMNAECRVPNYKLQIKIGMGAEGGEKGRVKTLPYRSFAKCIGGDSKGENGGNAGA